MSGVAGQQAPVRGVDGGRREQIVRAFSGHAERTATRLHLLAKLDQCLVSDDRIAGAHQEPGSGDVASKTCKHTQL